MGVLKPTSFEVFDETMRSIPLEEAVEQLDARIEKTKKDLIMVLRDTDEEAKRSALAYFSLLIMAKEKAGQKPLYNPWKEDSWMSVAREELEDFTRASSTNTSLIHDTILFDEDEDRRRHYATRVSSMIEPGWDFDDHPFVVGVALGEVALNEGRAKGRKTVYIS